MLTIGQKTCKAIVATAEGPIEFFFRPMTLEEAIKHDEGAFSFNRGDVLDGRVGQAVETGREILTGVGKDQVQYIDPVTGDPKPLDTDSEEWESPDDWKDILFDMAPGLMVKVCQLITSGGYQGGITSAGETQEKKPEAS